MMTEPMIPSPIIEPSVEIPLETAMKHVSLDEQLSSQLSPQLGQELDGNSSEQVLEQLTEPLTETLTEPLIEQLTPAISQPFGHLYGEIQAQSCKVLVMGMGESGEAMARWALANGASVDMYDTREHSQLNALTQQHLTDLTAMGVGQMTFGLEVLEASFNANPNIKIDSLLDGVHILAMSPGISPVHKPIASLLSRAREKNIAIWGELDFFTQALLNLEVTQQYFPKVIAITGTNGKTTTTALTGVICAKSGSQVALAGNISPALLTKLTECLANNTLPDIWVLELSSYQLYYSTDFNPHVATILNVTEDHLDWHGDMHHYAHAKAKIFGARTIPVINRDDARVRGVLTDEDRAKKRIISFGMSTPLEQDSFGIRGDMGGGIDWLAWAPPVDDYLDNQKIPTKKSKKSSLMNDEPVVIKNLIPAEALLIKGRHNATNALAALALANAIGLGISPLLHGLRQYSGEAHRVQTIGIVNDVEYVDDSKGTNVGALIAALQGLSASSRPGMSTADSAQGFSKNIILIAGGEGKGQDFRPLREPMRQFVKHLFLIGRDAQVIAEQITIPSVEQDTWITFSNSLEDAVMQAAEIAIAGNQVLLSPACASFDMFQNYEHRAQIFRSAVEELSISALGVPG